MRKKLNNVCSMGAPLKNTLPFLMAGPNVPPRHRFGRACPVLYFVLSQKYNASTIFFLNKPVAGGITDGIHVMPVSN